MEYANPSAYTLAPSTARASKDFIIEQPMNVDTMEGYGGDDAMDSDDDDEIGRELVKQEEDQDKPKPRPGKKTRGRVKIKFEYITKRERRFTTFSKRKTGLMKKAYELSALTGTQVMLLVASETGHVYTFATRKLMPIVTSKEGKELIQTCLSASDPEGESCHGGAPNNGRGGRGASTGAGSNGGNQGNHGHFENNGGSQGSSNIKSVSHANNSNQSNAGNIRNISSSKSSRTNSSNSNCSNNIRINNITESDVKANNFIGVSSSCSGDSICRSGKNINIHELNKDINIHEKNINTHELSKSSAAHIEPSDIDYASINKRGRLLHIPSSHCSSLDPSMQSSSSLNNSSASDICREFGLAGDTCSSDQIGVGNEGMVLIIPQAIKPRGTSDVFHTTSSHGLVSEEANDNRTNNQLDRAFALNLVQQPQQQNVVYVNVSNQQQQKQQNVVYVKLQNEELQQQQDSLYLKQPKQEEQQQQNLVYLNLPNQDQLVAVSLEDLQRSGLRILTDTASAAERNCHS